MIRGLHDNQVPRETDPDSGLPIGPRLADPGSAAPPERVALEGRYTRLEPIDPIRHRDALHAASTPPDKAARFRYLSDLPSESAEEFGEWLADISRSDDPLFFAVVDRSTGRAEGRQALMRIVPEQRCIEIGHIYWGPRIAGTRVATEALFLFSSLVFDRLGYRRFEWKCDALNAPSRRAALRFGFTYEGHFRRAVIVRDRSRDTTWFSMIDEEWPCLRQVYEAWLDPGNFDGHGRQGSRLSGLTAAALAEARRGS